jgi:signal transduction histidine kinase
MLCRSYSRKSDGVKKEEMEELAELVGDTLQRTRQYAHDSYPVDLESLGLDAALSNLCNSFEKQAGISCDYKWTIPSAVLFDKMQKLNIFRIIQEALHNVMKHSGAGKVSLIAKVEEKGFSFTVSDNGKGFNSSEAGNFGIGLNSMQYRANQIGADFSVSGASPHGTIICVKIKGNINE